MGKSLFIAEKPSVARQFAQALKISGKNNDGYIEGENAIVTWCVGHLVTMSYPEVYDMKYKKWSMETLPFLPEAFKYQVIDSVQKQFNIVKGLLTREDVETIYVCTDSGREGEYIYRLVEQESGAKKSDRRRVWIDSQTEDEIKRGVKEAKDLSEYDNLADAAYLRAKEDYLMGINFSRALTLRYGNDMARFLNEKYSVISVGRVMTCVLGMIVNREREIRNFEKVPFYRVITTALCCDDSNLPAEYSDSTGESIPSFEAEWKAVPNTKYFENPSLYKENGFKKPEDAQNLIDEIKTSSTKPPYIPVTVALAERKNEKKNAPLLYNLAELQNDCSKLFKISPDETLRVIQELYERKLCTYPRTDARVLSSAVAKEIDKNLFGLKNYAPCSLFVDEILSNRSYIGIEKTRYTNDKQITDHYAIIPTGQGLSSLNSLSPLSQKVYEIIVRRFIAIFYGPAQYQKMTIEMISEGREHFFAGFKVMTDEGYQKATHYSFVTKKNEKNSGEDDNDSSDNQGVDPVLLSFLKTLKKGSALYLANPRIKEGEKTPPKRYNSGNLILAMENAGQLIEDEELRAQIKGSGIGTSATRAEILKKLVNIKYLSLNKKTQIITPTLQGEMVYEVVRNSIPPLLDPTLTASWEKGLTMVAEGNVSEKEYMDKLNNYVSKRTNYVKSIKNSGAMLEIYRWLSQFYSAKATGTKKKEK